MAIFGKKYQIGLDIGNYAIQVASVVVGGDRAKVWRTLVHPARANRDDLLTGVELNETVRRALSGMDQVLNATKRVVVVGIQGASVTTGYLALPKLNDAEIEMAVRSTVAREVPFPIETLDIVHLPVQPLQNDKNAVFYTVWKKMTAHRIQEVAKFCNLTIRRIEACGVALTRELNRNRTFDPEQFSAIVNIGFELTQIVLVKGGYPYYLRDVPVGGRDITYAIQIGSQISWAEAEQVKKTLPLYEIIHTVNPILGEILYEIKRSLDYCCAKFPCPRISEIYLSGGTALLADFPEWLEEEIRIPVLVENWNKLEVVGEGEAPLNKVAVGLALGQ